MDVLGAVFVFAALVGFFGVMIAFTVPRLRQSALTLAVGGFAVAGLLSILSVGVIFLGLAILCGAKAATSHHKPPYSTRDLS